MTQAQHTPGPWTWTKKKTICHLVGGTSLLCQIHGNQQNSEANARLIAATPDLLESCEDQTEKLKFAWEYIRQVRVVIQREIFGNKDLPDDLKMMGIDEIDDLMLSFRKGEEAIAKAKGDTA